MNRTSHARHYRARSTSHFRTKIYSIATFCTTVVAFVAFALGAPGSPLNWLGEVHSTNQVAFIVGSPGTLGNYATAGLSGVSASIPPSNVATNATFSNLTRGSGLTATSVTNAFNSSGWTTSSAPDANDYYEFTITPNAAHQFSASELRVGLQRSSTGPPNVVLRTSLDSFASNIGPVISPPIAPVAVATSVIDLTTVTGLQNSSTPVTLRLYGYGASSSAGTLRIERVTTVPMVGLEVDGTVTSACTAPTITTHPIDLRVVYGQHATFTAAASGIPEPSVLWEVSVDSGDTWVSTGVTAPTLTVAPTAVAVNGRLYRAVFSNACGESASVPALLTVNVKPLVPGVTVVDKHYDGNQNATVISCTLFGVEVVDVGSVMCAAGGPNTFDDPNAGFAKTVTARNIFLSGPAAPNYTLTSTVATTAADIQPAPTKITPDSDTEGVNNDCTNHTYTAELKDTVSDASIAGVILKMTIGDQTVTATTDANGVATFTLVLSQPPDPVLQAFELDQSWSDSNRDPPPAAARNFQVSGDPGVGPGTDADSMYTGSLFFWTTSATSSTATLTLSATIKDSFEQCPTGDISDARVSFYVSSNGGGSFAPLANAQDLPVGLVDPSEPNIGAASAISQYSIGSASSATLIVRVVVGGYYNFSSSDYDVPITIGKSGAANSLMGGGKLKNDGSPFFASGYLGVNSISSAFGSHVQYNKKGTNPQGDVTVYVRSCNLPNGAVDVLCVPSDPSTHHVYFIKSNSVSELSLVNGSASFGSKTNVSEVMSDGTRVSLDGGNAMQLIFTPFGLTLPPSNAGNPIGATCIYAGGCASIVIYRSSGIGGGVWYSSSWGQPAGKPLQTWLKSVHDGTVSVQ